MNIQIRLEKETDYRKVEALTREAFWNLYKPGCDEHYLVHTMRYHADFIPDMAFVAECDHEIIGNIMFTKSFVINENDDKMETLTFGPLCVHPDHQRQGVGTALIDHTREIAVQKGIPAIIILGDPHNYCKHGFKTGKDLGISTMDGKYPLGLLALELQKGIFENHRWRFKESALYELDMDKAEAFDKTLEPREKKYHYSQDLFSMMVRAMIE